MATRATTKATTWIARRTDRRPYWSCVRRVIVQPTAYEAATAAATTTAVSIRCRVTRRILSYQVSQ